MTDKYTHKMYQLAIKFMAPMEGTIPMAAESVEDAIKIAKEQFSNRESFEVVSCVELEAIKPVIMPSEDDNQEGPVTKEMLN